MAPALGCGTVKGALPVVLGPNQKAHLFVPVRRRSIASATIGECLREEKSCPVALVSFRRASRSTTTHLARK